MGLDNRTGKVPRTVQPAKIIRSNCQSKSMISPKLATAGMGDPRPRPCSRWKLASSEDKVALSHRQMAGCRAQAINSTVSYVIRHFMLQAYLDPIKSFPGRKREDAGQPCRCGLRFPHAGFRSAASLVNSKAAMERYCVPLQCNELASALVRGRWIGRTR